MGFKDAMIPLLFFVVSIFGIAVTAITVKTYLDEKKEKDTNFNFSATILAASTLGLLISGFFTFKAFTSTGGIQGATAASQMAGSQTNLGVTDPASIARALEAKAENLSTTARHATEGAAAANQLQSALNKIKRV